MFAPLCVRPYVRALMSAPLCPRLIASAPFYLSLLCPRFYVRALLVGALLSINQNYQMDSIVFPNLKKLFIGYLHTGHFKPISKLKFPNLNFARVIYYENNDLEVDFNEEKETFIKLFKNVNELDMESFSVATTEKFISLKNLTKLTFNCYNMSKDDQLTAFDMIMKHQSLDDIRTHIFIHNYEIEWMKNIFEKVINLGKLKSNAKMKIKVIFTNDKDCDTKSLNEYIQEFQFNNWHSSLYDELDRKILHLKK